MNRLVLSVDIGTSSLKAALFDRKGTVWADTRCRFPRGVRTARHWTDAFIEAMCSLASTLTAHDPLSARPEIVAISISGNGPTLVSLDEKGNAGDLLLWNDPIPQTAASNSIFIPRINGFIKLFPESWNAAQTLLSGPEYLIYCLTGAKITILPEPRFAEAYWSVDGLSRARLEDAAKKLPPFVTTGTIAGYTSREENIASTPIFPPDFHELLPTGIPVIAGGPDFVVALIGTGTLESGKACDRAGTSEGLNVCVSSPIIHKDIRPLPSVIGGLWNAAYLLPETGAQFHAWRKGSGQAMRSYPDIMRDIESSPILPGAGETLSEGRALVERIGFSVRKGIETLRAATGLDPVFSLSGGQARNDIWNQMKADITGATFELTSTPDGELMGDAIVAFTALGAYANLKEAAREMVSVIHVYESDPDRHALYSEKYAKHENL